MTITKNVVASGQERRSRPNLHSLPMRLQMFGGNCFCAKSRRGAFDSDLCRSSRVESSRVSHDRHGQARQDTRQARQDRSRRLSSSSSSSSRTNNNEGSKPGLRPFAIHAPVKFPSFLYATQFPSFLFTLHVHVCQGHSQLLFVDLQL